MHRVSKGAPEQVIISNIVYILFLVNIFLFGLTFSL